MTRPSRLGPTLPVPVAPALAGVWKDRNDNLSARQLCESFISDLGWSMSWLHRLGTVGALASAITNSSAPVVIKLLGSNPILFGFDPFACAMESWMKATEEYSDTMSAPSPFLGSQGCTGLSDCSSFFHSPQENSPVTFSRCPPPQPVPEQRW